MTMTMTTGRTGLDVLREVAEGRGIAFLEGTLMREDSVVIATATATARILPSPNGSQPNGHPG